MVISRTQERSKTEKETIIQLKIIVEAVETAGNSVMRGKHTSEENIHSEK